MNPKAWELGLGIFVLVVIVLMALLLFFGGADGGDLE